jgi:hypothetical protein
VIGIEMILSKKGNTVLVSKIFASIPAIIGLNGMLDRSFARAIWGINIADGKFASFLHVSPVVEKECRSLSSPCFAAAFRCDRGSVSLDVTVCTQGLTVISRLLALIVAEQVNSHVVTASPFTLSPLCVQH